MGSLISDLNIDTSINQKIYQIQYFNMGKGEGSGEGWGEGEGTGTVQGMGNAEWKNGLFGCMSDGGNLLCGWCCFPCLLCQNANKMGESPVLYYVLSCITPYTHLFTETKTERA